MSRLHASLDRSSMMYRFLKWVVWFASISFVLITVLVVAVQIFLSSDEVIRIAEREGRKILGRKVSIDRLELGLFKIEASGIVIDDGITEKGGAKSKTPFVRFDDVEIRLNPSTLIYKRISVLQLTIHGASAHVRRGADGRFNFQDIIDNLSRKTSKEASVRAEYTFSFMKSAEAAENAPQGTESGFSFIIHELDLYNVKTEFRFDSSTVAPAFDGSCSFSHIEVDEIMEGKPLDVFLAGKCQKLDGQRLIELKGDAQVDVKGQNYRASFEMPLFDSTFLPAMVSKIPGYRFREGIFAGDVKFDYVVGKLVAWDIDLNGRDIHADFHMNRRAKWRRLAFPGLKLETKGHFNLLDGSARIKTLSVATPFLDAKLTKPSSWNVSAQDELHLEANILDMREMGGWVSRVTGISLKGLKEGATAQILISAKRDRRKSNDFIRIEIKSRFDPVDLAQFGQFIPSVEYISEFKGNVGGKAHVFFVSGERVQWDLAFESRDFGASVRMSKRKRWETLELGRTVLQSKGNFNIKSESVRFETLEIALPFATAKLETPAKWSVHGDAAEFSVEVSNFLTATVLLERFGLLSLEEVPNDARIGFHVAVSRNRKNSAAFGIDANARFNSLPVALLADLVPFPGDVQKVQGIVSGELQVASAPDGVINWKADIVGKKLSMRAKIISGEKWREVSLESLGLRSSGTHLISEGSSEVQKLDLQLPFARVYLNRAVLWNQRGNDEFSFTLDVADLSAAEVWLGEWMEHPVQAVPMNKKLIISLSGSRNRKDGLGFSYQGFASFDSVRISPWVKFVSLPPAFRNLAGEIGGKIEFSYTPEEKISWNIGLASEDMRGEFLARMSRNWRPLRTGKFRIDTEGSYDFQNQSGRLQSLNLKMPFGHLQISSPAEWNVNGMNSGRFLWTVSNLKDAARLTMSIWGTPVAEFSMAGSANGSMEISRNRMKTRPISTKWSFAANLISLSHAAYPNLNVAGRISGEADGGAIKLRIPTLRTIDSSNLNGEPDIFLQALNASLDRASIARGEIRAPIVRVEKLNIRYVRHAKGKTNFSSLFKSAKGGEERVRRARNREKEAASGEHRKIEKNQFLPAMKIARLKVARVGLYFQDFIATDKPPVVLRIPDAKLSVTNLDTRMVPGLRETRFELKTLGQSPSILVRANFNPVSVSPDVDGILNLSRFDLHKISPYVRDVEGESAGALLMQGTEITKGKLNFKSTYSLRDSQLKLEGRAKISGLRLKPDEKFPLAELVLKLLRASVFRLFERPNDTISLNVRISGHLDDPKFHFLGAIVESMFLGLLEKAQNLGVNLKDIVTSILGTAIDGVQEIVRPPNDNRTTPDKGSARELETKELKRGESQLDQFGKKLEKSLRKGLHGLLGIK